MYFAIHSYSYEKKISIPLLNFTISNVFYINNLREVTVKKIIFLLVETKYLNSHNTT